MLAVTAAVLTAAFVVGCGGDSGAGAQGTGGGVEGTGASAPTSMSITSSTPTISSDGRAPSTISVFVKDANNRALANQQVTFALLDPTVGNGGVLTNIVDRTDASGTATATLQITDPTNRKVTIQAQTGTLSQSLDLEVIGTKITLNGPANLVLGAQAEYNVTLRDAAGNALTGKPVALKSALGNAFSPATVTTGPAGQAVFRMTGSVAGDDTVTVSALNAFATSRIVVAPPASLTEISFSQPADYQEVDIAATQPLPVTVTYVRNGAPQAGQTIEFLATRGVMVPATAVTDASGRASSTILASPGTTGSLATAGISTITAKAGSLLATRRIEFVSTTPAKLALQASPANVGVNLTAASTNSSQLIAMVRDANDNPVKGQTVSFSAVADPSNGRIEPAVAVTDSSGVASVAFFPGANSSGFNKIEMKAEIPGKGVAGTTTLTASKQELVVRAGTGNLLVELDLATNSMPWSAVVTDASGNPVVGATVQASLEATGYYKGHYVWNVVRKAWDPAYSTPTACASEDSNHNLRLDAGEDTNDDKQLTPGNVAAALVSSANGRTDSNGLASINVNYPKDYGNWTAMRLRVTITTLAGTEGTAERRFVLPALAKDVGNELVAPPGQPSPFGRDADCRTTN
jgi:hypothetical protein